MGNSMVSDRDVYLISAVAGVTILVGAMMYLREKAPVIRSSSSSTSTSTSTSTIPQTETTSITIPSTVVSSSSVSARPSSSTSSSTSPSSSSTIRPSLSISPNSISLSQGAKIVISGSGYVPNSRGYITANNIQIAMFSANSAGEFSDVVLYEFNQAQVSGLANAIQDSSGNYITMRAYDFSGGPVSSPAILYFVS